MKTNAVSLSVLGTLVLAALLIVSILEIQHAYAQVDATSSDSTPPTPDAATGTTTDSETVTSADTNATTPTESSSITPTEPAPDGLTLVHIIGTKYVDYFTDGTTITSYPGDPAIDSNF